jgi:DNA-binding NarL/FixJ family response regulator
MLSNKSTIHVAAIDNSPIRSLGYGALLTTNATFHIMSLSLAEVQLQETIDVGVLHVDSAQEIPECMREITLRRPSLRVLLTTCQMDNSFTVCALMNGAKGCLDEAYSSRHLARAIRTIHSGLIWAPRRAMAEFVEVASQSLRRANARISEPFTSRERQVLELLVTGRSNKEIAAPLGIEERTVKAHVSALMRKVGVHNRIMLSKHALANAMMYS